MLGKALKVVVLCVVALLFAGCTSKAAFQITPLSDEASRIMFSQNKPMGCMLVGEQEGRAYVGNTNATMDMLEESAKTICLINVFICKQIAVQSEWLYILRRKNGAVKKAVLSNLAMLMLILIKKEKEKEETLLLWWLSAKFMNVIFSQMRFALIMQGRLKAYSIKSFTQTL